MKTLLLLTCGLIFLGLSAMAQCNPSIPSNAVVVSTYTTINGGFDPIWVCSGDTLHSDGGFHNTYLESGAVMFTNGGIDTIWVKSGAKLFMGGGIDYIIYDTITDLVLGGIPTLDSSCTAGGISFNYANAPANGCFVAPVAHFVAGDTSFCVGNCISFSNQSAAANSYSWSFPGGNPATSTDENPSSVCYNSSGVYDVTLIAMNGSGNDTLTLPAYIHVIALPVITVTPLEFCEGDSGLLVATGADSYSWNPPTGLSATTGDSVMANPTTTTTYTVTGTSVAGCVDSINSVVTVNSLPVISSLTFNGDTLFAPTGFVSYQWDLDGTVIGGATNYFYVASQSGTYHVLVTNDKGCQASAEIVFTYNGIAGLTFSDVQLNIIPNPSNGFFTLQINSLAVLKLNITVTDVFGKNISTQIVSVSKESSEFNFDLTNQPQGVYFINCTADKKEWNKKLVVLH